MFNHVIICQLCCWSSMIWANLFQSFIQMRIGRHSLTEPLPQLWITYWLFDACTAACVVLVPPGELQLQHQVGWSYPCHLPPAVRVPGQAVALLDDPPALQSEGGLPQGQGWSSLVPNTCMELWKSSGAVTLFHVAYCHSNKRPCFELATQLSNEMTC